MAVFSTYKTLGKTPLQALENYRNEHNLPTDLKMAYAGRLDPMAEGRLLLLSGETCKERDTYLHLDKEYEFEILLGFASDTYDILGILEKAEDYQFSEFNSIQIDQVLDRYRGNVSLPYPLFSSKTVKGKPLFLWALEGRADTITIPVRQSTIYKLDYLESHSLSSQEIYSTVCERIEKVDRVVEDSKKLGNDFRREEVLGSWVKSTTDTKAYYQIIKLRCIASSGTYMRTLASVIAQDLGSIGLAWSIKRTTIGVYDPYSKQWNKVY